jgi:hypothetical protein
VSTSTRPYSSWITQPLGCDPYRAFISGLPNYPGVGCSLTDQVEILRRREVLFVNGQSILGPSSGCSLDVRPDGSIE